MKFSLTSGALVAAGFLVLSVPVFAQAPVPGAHGAVAPSPARVFEAGSIRVLQPWSRATPAGAKVGGGYLRVTNSGPEADRLTGGTFPLAGRVEVHEMTMADNVMRMRQLSGGLAIGPGEAVELKPGGYHLMFMDLREGLKEGQTIRGTLIFEKAGPVEVEFQVRPLSGGVSPAGHQHH